MNPSQKPLDRFLTNNNLEMLEDAMPYLHPQFKKPLALFIKLSECTKIAREFDDPDTLNACGLCATNPNVEEMLCAMQKSAKGENAKQLEMVLNLIHSLKMFRAYQETMKMMPIKDSNASPNTAGNFNQNQLFETISQLMKGEYHES